MRSRHDDFSLIAQEVSRRTIAVTTRPGVGRVHSVFRRCFNVAHPPADWLTVALAPFPRIPDGIIVASSRWADFKGEGLTPGATVCWANGVLSVPEAGLRINLGAARTFETRRPPLGLAGATKRIARNLETAWTVLGDHGCAEGLGWARTVLRPLDGGASQGKYEYPTALCRRAVPAIMALCAGIRSNDVAVMQREVATLLGFGVGLTPSGDDVLGGLAAGLVLAGTPEGQSSFVSVLRAALRQEGRTTEVSVHTLRCITDGEISDIIHDAARAIAGREKPEVESTMLSLLSYGSTSGTETALGLCLGLRLAVELGREHGLGGES